MPENQDSAKASFAKVFGVGVIGWVVGSVVVFAASWTVTRQDSASSAMMWTMSHCWVAYLFGLLLMTGYGLARKLPLGRPLAAYLLPVLVLVALASLCLAVYPDVGFRREFLTYLPLVIVFHLLGLLWVALSGEGDGRSAFTRAVFPSLIGGLIVFCFVAVPEFTSDAFRYRDAFRFTITRAAVVNGEIHSEGTLEVRKIGNYEFVTPRYSLSEYLQTNEADAGKDVGAITWGSAGAPAAGRTGAFPFRIVWRKGVLPPDFTTLPEYENEVFLYVRDSDDNRREVYFLSAPMRNQ